MAISSELQAHLQGCATTLCRCWLVVRRDGVRFGFTDHDLPVSFDDQIYRATEGLSARAVEQTTGLAVDNSEALGVLSDATVRDEDVLAGLFDGAEVQSWLVNWSDPAQRMLQFRGTMGEIQRSGGGFRAELRGLTEALNQPQGRVYQSDCSAILGGGGCGFDFATPGFVATLAVETVRDRKFFGFAALDRFADRWFERGRLVVESGAATGSIAIIKNDRLSQDGRLIELWEAVGHDIVEGDLVRVEAGCDKRAQTCREKFDNMANFRGFPHIPGEDWLMAYPRSEDDNSGGSLVPGNGS